MTEDHKSVFRPTRRAILTGMAAAALLPKLGHAAGFPSPAEPPNLGANYRDQRHKFETHLIDKGPAPERYEPLTAPPDAEQILYRSHGIGGNQELVAWVSQYKRTAKKLPAVLFLHGGNAIGQGHWTFVKPYIDAGYVVMIPSMRGENGQKGVFSGFYNEVDDVLAASDRLRHLPGVDPERMFLAGHSIGGTLAMLTAMSTRRFRAAAPMSGNPDAWAFFNRYPEDIRFDTHNPQEFEMRSPACYVPSIRCPMRVTHGSQETQFVTRLDLFAKRAKEAKVKLEVAVVEGSHVGALPAEVAQSIQFFKGVAA